MKAIGAPTYRGAGVPHSGRVGGPLCRAGAPGTQGRARRLQNPAHGRDHEHLTDHFFPRLPVRQIWAVLIARIDQLFPLLCPMCGAQMHPIAFITYRAAIRH